MELNREIKLFTVEEITNYLKGMINNDHLLQDFWITGEISNFYHHSSGHMYFTLKDNLSQLKCVMFKGYNNSLDFEPEDGQKVTARGNLDIYKRRGEYQFYAREMQVEGRGALFIAFEKLKKKLKEEGLFAPEEKKAIPILAKRIGIITSPTGAAVRDVLSVMKRRRGNFSALIVPTHVQGKKAAAEIIEALEYLNSRDDIDLIIVTRGGGSIEDLWPFNEELVARAIYNSRLPVISGVGHETDFTISDFVADLRAPTPSAAAEIATANREEILNRLDSLKERLKTSIKNNLKNRREKIDSLSKRRIFAKPEELFFQYEQLLDQFESRLKHEIENTYNHYNNKYQLLYEKLNNLSPLNTLSRGYAVLNDKNNKLIKTVDDVEKGDYLSAKLVDGKLGLRLESKEKAGEYDD
ncbi:MULTISPECIES: exodeoxyribonuclease VII large subunit [unclassified Halanaerobium]|uniref:exodeoxyribonuclease VII large subunit n=1 Tax=unclassified Halanaerobium TaxID=2641197 RepID=UPI000DF39297|nr:MULTISPECIES: exodeoxyribonuclease VII large subunit [unclassified Halanaerobium]RCW50548.1 exodeoxyribonuclease VII large subunit [Halanaerobium sp. MA284_MarDTE_T2]RCW82184.1 exodeoxyribonuclease VII large subunit [Halanaerobium sp. DL-01]